MRLRNYIVIFLFLIIFKSIITINHSTFLYCKSIFFRNIIPKISNIF